MSKVFLSGAGTAIDTNIQTVVKGQIIQMNGYFDDRFVVYDVAQTEWGLNYKLVNLRTNKFAQCDLVRPLSQKHGIGYYFNDENLEFMDVFEIAILCDKAEQIDREEKEALQREDERKEQLRAIGRERLNALIPTDAKAVIIAELRTDESDSMTDYFAYRTQRTVILGFSKHTRDLFSEMRKFAANFDETAYLTEENKEYEHREKYSMGEGFYLGKSKYSGWTVKKERLCGTREQYIERYALAAGDENNICVRVRRQIAEQETETSAKTINGDFVLVDYSEKALAVFGDTRAIKDHLKALGGRFNPRLSHDNTTKAGWVFPKTKKQALRNLLTIK